MNDFKRKLNYQGPKRQGKDLTLIPGPAATHILCLSPQEHKNR